MLLLGAGASITSGIPAAGKTVEKVARWAWCKENGRHPDDFTIRRSDYWPWFTAQPWYKPDLSSADLYPEAIDNLLGVKSDRREFFEKLINPPEVLPLRGYVALTQILHQGWMSDMELDPVARDGEFTFRRTITGNLWSQLDDLIDLLALVNFQFRLKAKVSRTVNAYNAIAIKETGERLQFKGDDFSQTDIKRAV